MLVKSAPENKVKYMSQKRADGTYTDPLPFAVFGNNVEMQSNNTLEEELKLGGPCLTSIRKIQKDITQIIEDYREKDGNLKDYYQVITMILPDGNIKQWLYVVRLSNSERILVKTKDITFGKDEGGSIIDEIVTNELTLDNLICNCQTPEKFLETYESG